MLKYLKSLMEKIKLLSIKPMETLYLKKSIAQFTGAFPELRNFLSTYPRYIWVLIITGLLPFILSIIVFLFLTMLKPSLTVPQLEGLSLIDAANIIQEQKFSITLIPEDSEDYPQNFIIHQDIAAGRKIKEGRTLLLYVSNGKNNINFPSLVGNNIYKVESNLKQQADITKAINIKNINWQNSTKPFGEILAQNPQSGNYKNFPIAVDLIVSNGSGSSVPNYINEYATTAYYKANELGLNPQLTFEKTKDPNLDGKIIRQNPKEQTPINPNMNIQLVVAQFNQDIHYFTYKIDPELAGKTIALIINDNKGRRILFLGLANAGDVITASSPVFGSWKAGIYIYEGENQKTLYKDLSE